VNTQARILRETAADLRRVSAEDYLARTCTIRHPFVAQGMLYSNYVGGKMPRTAAELRVVMDAAANDCEAKSTDRRFIGGAA
jgi:hypothetical protein